MPKTIAVIGARLNSSRLPRKHLLDLAGQPLIARIIQRLSAVPEFDNIILATTADPYNQPLVELATASGWSVFPFDGDVNDLVGRIDAVVRQERAEMLVYVCGDSPLVEPTTISRMIQTLRDHPEAGTVHLDPGEHRYVIHEGFDIYRRSLWDRLVSLATRPHEREHVGASLKDRDDVRAVSLKEDPEFCQLHHRLSVDTPSDYRFMREVYRSWYAQHEADSLVSLAHVINRLQNEPELAAINATVHQKTLHQRSAAILLIGECGRLQRLLAIIEMLQDRYAAGVFLIIVGDRKDTSSDLCLIPHHQTHRASFSEVFTNRLKANPPDHLVVDLTDPATVELVSASGMAIKALEQEDKEIPPDPEAIAFLCRALIDAIE